MRYLAHFIYTHLKALEELFSLLLFPQQHTFIVVVLLLFPSHVIWRESFSESASVQLAANDENECTKVSKTRQGSSSHFHLNTRLPFIHLKPQDVFIHSGTRGDTFNAHREFNFRSFVTVVVCVSCWKTPNEWNFQLNFSIIVVVAPVERWTKRRKFSTPWNSIFDL